MVYPPAVILIVLLIAIDPIGEAAPVLHCRSWVTARTHTTTGAGPG
jgi:hypothetical protein